MYQELIRIITAALESELTSSFVYVIVGCLLFAFVAEFVIYIFYKINLRRVLKRFKVLASSIQNKRQLSDAEVSLKHQYFSNIDAADKLLLTHYPVELSTMPGPSRFRFMTSILTSIGVIGTFLGIVVGLAGIQDKLQGNSEQSMGAIKSLLGGMDVAFMTSLAGLSSSIILLVLLKLLEGLAKNTHSKTLVQFSGLYRLESLGDFLEKLTGGDQDEVIEKQLEAAKKSAEASEVMLSMGTSLEKAANNFDADKIGQHLSTSLDKIFTQEMVPVFSEISAELKSLREIKQDNGEKIIQAIMGQLRTEVIEPLSQQISETSSLIQTSTDSVNKLHDGLGDVALKLSGAVSTLQTFQQETMEKLGDFSQDLRGILASFQGETKVILEGVSAQLSDAVKASVEVMDDQKVAFQQSADQAALTFSGIKTELEQSLESQAKVQKEMLDDTAGRVKDILTQSHQTHDAQVTILTKVGETASGLMNNARDNLSATLSNVDSVLIETKNTVTEQLDQFRVTYQSSLDTFFTQQNNLLENTLGKQRDGLAEVVQEFNDVFLEEYGRRKELSEQLETNLASVLETTSIVNNLVEATSLYESAHLNQVEQSAKTIGLQVGLLQKSYQGSSELFGELLTQIPEELNKYFDRANQSYEEFFSEMDKASAQIHNRLLQSAEYLISSESQRQMMNDEEVT
jgi:hypothetical protein